MISEFAKNILFNFKKRKYTFNPVFIIGCGRSGTTILGETLSNHPKIKYLNERRDLWHKAYPEFDIWSDKVENSKLYANKNHFDFEKTALLKTLFFQEQVLGNSEILLEKLPINTFRLEFINKSFPNAKYIYLTRNGLEVSKSIERRIQKDNWFTGDKFNLLKQFSTQKNINFDCEINSERENGMWEWRLSMQESDQFFKKMNTSKFTHLSYQDFIHNTNSTIKQIFEFLNLQYSDKLILSLSKKIELKSNPITESSEENLMKIGGDILNRTINNSYSPF